MTVAQLSATMGSYEFSEWRAIDRYFEPFGDEWRQVALLCIAVLTPHVRKSTKLTATDFMPLHDVPQTPAEVAAQILKMQAMSGESCPVQQENPETP